MIEQALMQETIWFDQPKFEEAETMYQLHLVGACKDNGPKEPQGGVSGGSALVSEIAKARETIKKSLDAPVSASSQTQKDDHRVASLEKENKELRKLISDLTSKLSTLETRVSKLEGSQSAPSTIKASTAPAPPKETEEEDEDDDDDEMDLFGSDEDDEEAEKIKQERLKMYEEKKAKKTAVIAKSSIILDVKPWDDETDLAEMEQRVREISTDGLLWGASKLVPVAYGVKKLQINCIVEDDKVGTDFLEEEITGLEDFVQSVDVVAFNKI